MELVRNAFDRFRSPEYTGENRCLPCTVLNVIIAFSFAGLLALVWPPGGAFVLVSSFLVIAFRGYLIPKTPTLTARYLPKTALRWVGKTPAEQFAVETASDELVRGERHEIEELLRSADVAEIDPLTDELQLAVRFRDAWWRRIRRFRDGDSAAEQLATVLEVDPRKLSIDSANDRDRVIVSFEDATIARWNSEAAFYADLAVEPTLREWLPRWDELGDDRRTELIAGMRAFLEACPLCEADIETAEKVRESCCSGDFVSVTVACEECESAVISGFYR